VGATNWFIRVPFLIEGIVAALVGAIAAIVVLGVLMTLFVTPAQGLLDWLPVVHLTDLIPLIPILLGAGVIVAVISSFLGMRRFLDT
jgi:cell division transport system permease protein